METNKAKKPKTSTPLTLGNTPLVAELSGQPPTSPVDIYGNYADASSTAEDKYKGDTKQYAEDTQAILDARDRELTDAQERSKYQNIGYDISDATTNINRAISGLGTGFADTSSANQIYEAQRKDTSSLRDRLQKELEAKKAERVSLQAERDKGQQGILKTFSEEQAMRDKQLGRAFEGVKLREEYKPIKETKGLPQAGHMLAKQAGWNTPIEDIENMTIAEFKEFADAAQSVANLKKAGKVPASDRPASPEQIMLLNEHLKRIGKPEISQERGSKMTSGEVDSLMSNAVGVVKSIQLDEGETRRQESDLRKKIETSTGFKSKMDKLVERRAAVQMADDAIKSGNQAALAGIPTILAKASGQVGVLTDRDVAPYQRFPGFQGYLKQWSAQNFDSTMFDPKYTEALKVFIKDRQMALNRDTKNFYGEVRQAFDTAVKNNKIKDSVTFESLYPGLVDTSQATNNTNMTFDDFIKMNTPKQ